jgi:hypothetical protein
VVVEIRAGKELTYSIIDDGTRLMSGTPDLLLDGKKASQYSGTATKSAKEHFDAPNYKLTSFDDAYNAVTVKNKNGVNVEFRAYNSGVAYRFVTTSTKGAWTVTDEVADFTFADDFTHGGACTYQWSQIRIVVAIHGRRDSHDVKVAVTDLLDVTSADEAMVVDGILQQFVAYLKGGIVASHKGIATLLVHVETHGGVFG